MPRTILLCTIVAVAGCGGGGGGGDADAGEDADDAGDAPADGDGADETDAEPPDGDDGDDADEASPPDPCGTLGLPRRDFADAAPDESLYATAADFTVPTREGDWTFSEGWSGCDTYLFIQDVPRQAEDWPVPLWDRDVSRLLRRAPRNVHFFFVSTERTAAARDDALSGLATNVDAALGAMTDEDRAWWATRIHYVTDAAESLEGWLGDVMTSPGWGAGIDRFQRIRYIGSYADWTRWDESHGWFAPNLSMAANEAVYYNFEAEREARLEAEEATIVHVFAGDVLSGGTAYADVTLPDAAAMAAFDTMELDLYLGCDGDGEYGTCPAWDYIVNLFLCDAGEPTSCDTEFGRWITTYHREGRWVHDVSGLLPLVAAGGVRRFGFYTQQPYEVALDIRLSSQGKPARPVEATFLFSGGAFGPAYNDGRSPIAVRIPADAVRVELATVITGHGMADPGNCAEFCNTTHQFLVNGYEFLRDFPQAGTDHDCMDQAAQGTVPNQYGTWWYGRSGWCPGREAPMVMIDVTDRVVPGEDGTFEYNGFYRGAPYPAGGASIVMTSWVVVSR